jgi:TatA/E family protein of Tat protein translocase
LDIFGVGPLEIVVILVIALLVFGPDKLPEIGAKLGQSVRELRNLPREITQGVDSARGAVTGPVEELSRPFREAGQVVHDLTQAAETMRNPGQALEKALVGQLAPAKASAPQTENAIAPPGLEGGGTPAPRPDAALPSGDRSSAAASTPEPPAITSPTPEAPVPEEHTSPSPEALGESWEI